jgi:predicted transcriptional regulator
MRRSSQKPDVLVNAMVPREMAEALKKIAAAEDRSVSAILRRLISEFLQNHKAA